MKQHSKEYLIELANNNGTPDWLRLLISKAIETNGDVSLADMSHHLFDVKKKIVQNSTSYYYKHRNGT